MREPNHADVRAAVASYEDAIVELTRRLVAIPTENPPGRHYLECVDVLEAELERLDLAPRRIDVPADDVDARDLPRAVLQAGMGEGSRALYFHGHYDVVPAQDASQFDPRQDDERLYGRGTADMKGGLAAMIYAMVALRDLGVPEGGRVALNLVPDEETGGDGGSRVLAASGELARDGIGMVTAEPTSGVVWNANRGAISMRATTHGRSAHVGLAYSAVNAFEHMLTVAEALRRLGREVAERKTDYRIAPEAARRSILLLGGQFESGANFNVVPATCTMTLDRRPNPEESLAEEKQRLLDTFEELRASGIELAVETFQEAPPSGTPEDDPLATALADAIESLEGKRPRFEMCPGLLEIRWYAQQGLPAFAYGPGRLEVAHQADEHVEISALTRAAAVYTLTAASMLGT